MLIDRFLKSVPVDLPAVPIILDIGSNTGEQACEFAEQFPNAKVFAFEARPQSAELIRRSVTGKLAIQVVEGAVHEFDGETVFYAVDEMNPGASSLFVGSGVQAIHPIQQTSIRLPALRLDTGARQNGIDRFDLVWMDLQGAELLALRGMGTMLATVRSLQLEITYRELYYGQVMWPEVRQYLEAHGLRLVDEWPDVCGYFGDAVFIRG